MQHLEQIWPGVLKDGVHAMPFSTTQQFSVLDPQDLAEACAIVADSDNHFFVTYEPAGPQALSQDDMAEINSKVLGEATRAEKLSLEPMKKNAQAADPSNDRIDQMLIMSKHCDVNGFRGNPNILEYILDRPATRFESYVRSLGNESRISN